jgi:CRP/FNR family cyclic AMP-dependent transcriptional regulator
MPTAFSAKWHSLTRTAAAIAVTDVTLAPISEKQFLFLISQTPFFAFNVMRVLARRLRASNNAL